MKRTIRYGVFETNSSSTHSLCICTEDEYERWKNGELLFDSYREEFTSEKFDYWDEPNKTFDEYWDDEYLEPFEEEYVSPSGDRIVVFGKYGWDG